MGNNGSNARPHKQYRYSGARKAKKHAGQGHAPPPPYRSSAPGDSVSAPASNERRTSESKPTRTVQSRLITGALRDINEFYSIERKEIGQGSFGTVRVGVDKSTGRNVAIKTLPKFQISQPDVMQSEIRILRSLDHPNIIKFHDVCEGPRHIHIITELCTGGELFDRIIARGHFSEADAATLIRKILSAVAHCHDRGICHRDLKPENCLFATNAEDADLKVIDFGLSCMDDSVTGGNVMKTRVGSIYYVAPEVLKGRYDKSCDLWSIGVIVYILLCGYPPFYGDTDSDVFDAVMSGKFEFDTAEWSAVSDAAKGFIIDLLVVDPTKRLTAHEALRHPWLSGGAPLTQIGLSSDILSSLKRFTGHNKLKKAALEVIADQMTENDLAELKQQFMSIDKDGNGVITMAELAQAVGCIGHGVMTEEVLQMLQGVDVDGDGLIDYPEFLAATVRRNVVNKQEHLINAFNYFDTRKQGVITKADLVQFMKSEEQAEEILNEIDINGDGQISFEEFLIMMERNGFEDAHDGKNGLEWEF